MEESQMMALILATICSHLQRRLPTQSRNNLSHSRRASR